MTWIKLVNLILLISDQIKSFIVKRKKDSLIQAKNEALENGDQRVFENEINEDSNVVVIDLPAGKYNGMYERAAKKKP